MNKKYLLCAIVGILLCVLLYFLVKKYTQDPFDYLKSNAGSDNATSVNELLYQTNNSNEYVIFYVNGNNNLACAIMKKTFLSYKILTVSSEVSLSNQSDSAQFHWSAYNSGKNWIDWGLIRDNHTKSVLVGHKAVKLVPIQPYSFRIYYLMGTKTTQETEQELPPSHQLVD